MSARDSDHKWHRHPSMDCYQTGSSKSEISRDMFCGLHLWILHNKRADVICSLIDYGERHNWIMGDGNISRRYFTPSMRATAYSIRHHLTGQASWKRHIPRDWYRPMPFCIASSLTGFQRHLQILNMLVNFGMREPSSREISLLEYYAKDQPNNALFSAILHSVTDRDFSEATYLLLNTEMFPNNNLPDTSNYDSHYLWQRDESTKDWLPKPNGLQFVLPAVDWLFSAQIILGGLSWQI